MRVKDVVSKGARPIRTPLGQPAGNLVSGPFSEPRLQVTGAEFFAGAVKKH